MTTKPLFALLLTASLFFTACKKELEPQENSGVKADSTATAATPAAPTAITPIQANQPVQTTTAVAPQSAPMAKTAPGMNPPHGQPGHRCDISVGAPLNSKPAKAPTTTTVATPGSATIKPITTGNSGAPALLSQPAATPVTATAPGMNPPHGQEGHVCSVAVGAPLPK